MSKRRFSITASEQDGVHVLAAYDKTEGPAKMSYLAMLSCDSCNHTVLGPNSENPFCPCCTGNLTASSEELLPQTKADIEKMEELGVCENCNTAVAAPSDIEASFDDGRIYCPACTHPITLKASEDSEDEEEDDNENEDETDMSDTVEEGETLFDSDKGEGGASDETSTSETPNEGEGSADTTTETSGDSATADKPVDTPVETPSIQANLLKALEGKSSSDISLTTSPDRNKWFLFVDGQPVAVADKEAASENVAGMFNSDKFSTAWEAATANGITEDVLNDFGFKATTTDVPVEEAVKQNLEAAIEESTKRFNMTAAEVRDRYTRCMGIAAVGMNKKVFKAENPVAIALVASLKNLRVKNAEAIVANAFATHGKAHLRNLVSLASELMEKSDEVLEDNAKLVDEAQQVDEAVIEDTTIPKITAFPAPVKDKEVTEEQTKPTEIAASDTSVSDTLARMRAGMRRRNG